MGVVNRGLKVVGDSLIPTGYEHNLEILPPQLTITSIKIRREKW